MRVCLSKTTRKKKGSNKTIKKGHRIKGIDCKAGRKKLPCPTKALLANGTKNYEPRHQHSLIFFTSAMQA